MTTIASKRAVLGLVPLLVAAVACGSDGDHATFRIYDPSNQSTEQVSGAEVVPSSVRVVREPEEAADVLFRLTPAGARKFTRLTRALAQRGARAKRPQSFALELDGRIRFRPQVDYRLFPNGVTGTGSTGIQIYVEHFSEAREIANRIRDAAS